MDDLESVLHPHGCGLWGAWLQRSSKASQTSKMVVMYQKRCIQLFGGQSVGMQASFVRLALLVYKDACCSSLSSCGEYADG